MRGFAPHLIPSPSEDGGFLRYFYENPLPGQGPNGEFSIGRMSPLFDCAPEECKPALRTDGNP
ncbi:hypothetical protein SUTMEG_13900 [Sutterella megalosphaeroides]|uniref:Uncharacterized protein n=1 Tax=Sutterella megalosphaeroides TaxID=2494234 RepID=A0A2Z6IAN0_9BURK|nr:hypothetical protein SUTMEG_13900 [Sutterella megalosphaeroides]